MTFQPMRSNSHGVSFTGLPIAGLLCVILTFAGCHSITGTRNSIPASAIDSHLFGSIREAQMPVLLSALGQEEPAAYRLGPGDTLSIYIYGVLPPTLDETPVLSSYQTLNQKYYPPRGSVVSSSIGLPITVGDEGQLELPFVGQVPVAGLTVEELVEKLKRIYAINDVVAEGRERITAALIKKRYHRVIIFRQDSPSNPVRLTSPEVVDEIHRGSGVVIDLPAYENDVAHALSATGGLPGTDGAREVWVMRNCALSGTADLDSTELARMLKMPSDPQQCGPNVLRIPLYLDPGEKLPFSPKDVVLETGDVVYIPRRHEYYYTGGLLGGARVPLPRDEDIDIIEAIALRTGSVGGPLGQDGSALAGGVVGYAIKPTRAVVIRQLPDGSQINIRVDLARAMEDEKERILIRPDDFVMMNFTPAQGTANAFINFVRFRFFAPILF